jgi:NAD(P)-dependent dehydrogenase (short-subunit alcohol dehydrogenase family)
VLFAILSGPSGPRGSGVERPSCCPTQPRVNAVSPGPTRTEGTAAIGELLAQSAANAPLNRVATPEEIAAGIVFLASDEASMIHGAVLPVDGGRLAV